jgi:hypothetical protein
MEQLTITLDGLQEETLRGYLGELVDETTEVNGRVIPAQDLPVLASIYVQLIPKEWN